LLVPKDDGKKKHNSDSIYGTAARKFTDEDFDSFIKQADDTSEKWKIGHHDEEKGLTIWQKSASHSSINILRARIYFKNIQAETLYDILHDHDYRKTWDENMLSGYVIEVLDSTTEVGYYAAKMPTPLANRDFVNQRSWKRYPEKKMWIIVNHSVIHENGKAVDGFVRAWSYQTGYLIRQLEDSIEFTYCTQSDPRGWIPGWVVNMAVSTIGPSYIEKLKTAAIQYESWSSQQKGHTKPWLNDK